MRIPKWCLIMLTGLCACSGNREYDRLQDELNGFCADKDAKIGVAVIIDGKDTVSVNGGEAFPMLSVYKFPIALAMGEAYRDSGRGADHQVAFFREDLHVDTYSPMTERILSSSKLYTDTLRMPASRILAYMLQQSDNNASDIALRETGGADKVESYIAGLGVTDMHVRSSEAEMHDDNSMCYANSSTPVAMASLLDRFDREFGDSISLCIKNLMETCTTGQERLVKPISGTGAVVGHKTGTGFTLPDGRLMAVNDAGYVRLPSGRRYTIAVFIENSGYDMARTEALIAEISRIVYDKISH